MYKSQVPFVTVVLTFTSNVMFMLLFCVVKFVLLAGDIKVTIMPLALLAAVVLLILNVQLPFLLQL